MSIPELLAPAGGMEQLQAAIRFGADAVYVGMAQYGLRAYADNFDETNLSEAVHLVHRVDRKLYVTLNVFPWDEDFPGLLQTAKMALEAGVDAAIVSDVGVVAALRAEIPALPLHVSTQAHTVNAHAAAFWHAQGVCRVIVAREMSLERIAAMRRILPETLELEAFVHGAMCYAYSGRCLMSQALTGREANHGACAQPCRWAYHMITPRHAETPLRVEADAQGSYVLSAYDLCMIHHIPALCQAGLSSLKIEGRMKNAYYVATVVSAYRRALDAYAADPAGYAENEALRQSLQTELEKASHRDWNTGFYFGMPTPTGGAGTFAQSMECVAQVLAYDASRAEALVQLKNRFFVGDKLEALTPDGIWDWTLMRMRRAEDETELTYCGVPHTKLWIDTPHPLAAGDLLRGPNRNHLHNPCE